MSQPCCAIDVHTHVVPARLPDERPEFAGLCAVCGARRGDG